MFYVSNLCHSRIHASGSDQGIEGFLMRKSEQSVTFRLQISQGFFLYCRERFYRLSFLDCPETRIFV